MSTTINIGDIKLKAFKAKVKEEGRTIKWVMAQLIDLYLEDEVELKRNGK